MLIGGWGRALLRLFRCHVMSALVLCGLQWRWGVSCCRGWEPRILLRRRGRGVRAVVAGGLWMPLLWRSEGGGAERLCGEGRMRRWHDGKKGPL